MKKNSRFLLILFLSILQLTKLSYSQGANQNEVITIGIFDGKIVSVGNFKAEQVYKINDYCIALTEIIQSQVDSFKGKKVLVKGSLKIIEGKMGNVKTSNDGKIYEPYKEPDKKFIIKPVFTIVYDAREPMIQK
jgi:hypothetical protein